MLGSVRKRQPDREEGGQGEDRNQGRLGHDDDEGRHQEPGADDEQRPTTPTAVGQGARRGQGDPVDEEGDPGHPRPLVAEPRVGPDLEGGEDEDDGDQPGEEPEQLSGSDGRGRRLRVGRPMIALPALRPHGTRTQLCCAPFLFGPDRGILPLRADNTGMRARTARPVRSVPLLTVDIGPARSRASTDPSPTRPSARALPGAWPRACLHPPTYTILNPLPLPPAQSGEP